MIGKRWRAIRKYGHAYICGHPPKGRRSVVHHYYHNPKSTDVDAMRKEANRRLTDNRFPEESIIHYHEVDNPCDVYKHESFNFPAKEK